MSGTNRKCKYQSGKTGRRVLGDVEERRPVDEDGAFEASDAEKRKLMANHPPPSYSFFCHVWSTDFDGNFKFRPSRFNPCMMCAPLNANANVTSDHEAPMILMQNEYEYCKELTEWIGEQRRKYYKHRKKAETQPSK